MLCSFLWGMLWDFCLHLLSVYFCHLGFFGLFLWCSFSIFWCLSCSNFNLSFIVWQSYSIVYVFLFCYLLALNIADFKYFFSIWHNLFVIVINWHNYYCCTNFMFCLGSLASHHRVFGRDYCCMQKLLTVPTFSAAPVLCLRHLQCCILWFCFLDRWARLFFFQFEE